MRDSADYQDPASLIEEARFAYSKIYYWHIGQGKRRFQERFKDREESEAWRTKYLALVAELVKPKKATVKDMLHVAREVLSGRMEWAYHEKNEQGVTLSNCARREDTCSRVVSNLLLLVDQRLGRSRNRTPWVGALALHDEIGG